MTAVSSEQALRRLLEALSPEELAAVATGRARIEVRRADPPQPDPAQLRLYAADGGAQVPARRQPPAPLPARDHGVDVAEAVTLINTLPTAGAVEEYLHDRRFTLPVLKQIARALGPTVLATGRSKAEVRRDIVAGTIGFRSRAAAMSGGAWN